MKQLQSLLLQLISPRTSITADEIAKINGAQWQSLLEMAQEHRILPLLYWRLITEHAFALPEAVSQKLHQSFRRSTFKSLRQQRQLLQLSQLFDEHQIPYMALKGSQLVGLYPHRALRPMRDLDLLIPESHIMTAYQLLIAQGYHHPKGYQKDLASYLALQKHLPLLVDPSGQLPVELHIRVLEPSWFADQDFTDEADFWQRSQTITLSGQTIRVMSATDLLLHLIIHSCYDHYFNNGPLIFSDLFYLLQTETIDWSQFWQMAQQRNITQGCLLVLEMVRHYYEMPEIEIPTALLSIQTQIAKQAPSYALLTLQNYSERANQASLSLLHQQHSLWGKINIIRQKLLPPRQLMGLKYPVDPHSFKVWKYYFYHVGKLLLRIPQYLALRHQTELDHEAKDLARLKNWLNHSRKH
ncbi:nucleotidyltransferase family protein [Celerinatantimonas sp. YJH-8]|uniref:nucleotidyltransferase domain-containing protein n=1 Tax=Celerinatantimonas sp. YJH-8 TaxID=3228714 RepID=UPI0038C95A14